MEEIAHLIIRVSSDQTEAAKKRLKELGYAAKETETATGGLMSAWRAMSGLLAGVVGIGTAVAALTKLRDTAKQFESLEAQLKTATGSAENAKAAFVAIQDFATQTPYDLAQSTEAFIKLVNLGLTPSERALRSYGDTASAMGKDLRTMVQAVANATTGEFEILKQFGVKARSEADGVSFTFRGLTEKVKNDARSIEEYFIRLGEKDFGGAMAERMATLEGKLSNLGDAWDVLFATIAKAGAGDVMKRAIDGAIDAIERLTSLISTGQFDSYLDAITAKFEILGADIEDTFSILSNVIEDTFKDVKNEGEFATSFLSAYFGDFFHNARIVMKGVGASFAVLVEVAIATGKGVYEAFSANFDLLLATSRNVGKEIASHLDPRAEPFDFVKAEVEALKAYADRAVATRSAISDAVKNATSAWSDEIDMAYAARDAANAAYDAHIKKARELSDEHKKNIEVRKALNAFFGGGDRLAQFGVGTKGTTREFDKLVESLRTQEQALADSFAKRKTLIEENTAKESQLRADLLAQLEVQYGEERKKVLDRAGADVEVKLTALEDGHALEMAVLTTQFDEKQKVLDDAIAAKLISEEEYARRSQQLEERRASAVKQLTIDSATQIKTAQLGIYADVISMAAGLADQMSDLVQGNNAASKAMFVAAKAIAIAQAIVYTELAATRALAEGGMFAGIPMSTLMRATGYASVALMAAQSVTEYSGKFEHGGMIPSGRVGMVGEAGAEFVRGPAVVTSARSTADLMAGANGGTSVTVNVINQGGNEVETRERDSSEGKIIDVIIKRTKAEITRDINTGGNPLDSALRNSFGLRRGAA